MALLSPSEQTQHRLLSLAATGVLVAATATAVTWRVPAQRADALSVAKSGDELLVELGEAAGDALALAEVSNEALGRAGATPTGGRTVSPAGLLPIPTEDSIRAARPRAPRSGIIAFTQIPGQTPDQAPRAAAGRDPGTNGVTVIAPPTDDLTSQLTAARNAITQIVLGGGLPALEAVSQQLGDAAGDTLAELSRATASTKLAATTGTLADTTTGLADAVRQLGATMTSATAVPLPLVGGDAAAALNTHVAGVQRHLTLVIAAVETHRSALRDLSAVALPALPVGPDTPGAGTDGTELAYALATWASLTNTALATTVADTVGDADTTGEAASQAAAQLAWTATDAATAARGLGDALGNAPTVPTEVATLAARLTSHVAATHAAAATLNDSLTDAAGAAATLGGLPGALHAQICAALDCVSGWQQTQPSAAAPLADPITGDASPAPTSPDPSVVALVDIADLDQDGDVDQDDLMLAGDTAGLVISVILRNLDVNDDREVDEVDAAATIATTPIGAIAATLHAQAEAMVAELETALRAAGTQAQSRTDPVVQTALALVAAADSSADGTHDRSGIASLYRSVDVADAILAFQGTVERSLDRDGDGALTLRDSGCILPSYGVYASDTRRELETLRAGPELDASHLAALTAIQLVQHCAIQTDAAPDAETGTGTGTGTNTIQAQLTRLIATVTPACATDPSSCTIAFKEVANVSAVAAQTQLDEATAQLAETLDINRDGSITNTDGNAFGDRSFKRAWSDLTMALDAIDGTVDGDSSGTAQALYDSRPTTAGVLAIAEAVGDIATQLIDQFDLDRDGAISEHDARTFGDALHGILQAVPIQSPTDRPTDRSTDRPTDRPTNRATNDPDGRSQQLPTGTPKLPELPDPRSLDPIEGVVDEPTDELTDEIDAINGPDSDLPGPLSDGIQDSTQAVTGDITAGADTVGGIADDATIGVSGTIDEIVEDAGDEIDAELSAPPTAPDPGGSGVRDDVEETVTSTVDDKNGVASGLGGLLH
jgi:hypothetical protein